MSIQVENNLKDTDNEEVFEQRAHYVPCKIEEDGPANVQKYFEPNISEIDGDLTATFRGHPLDGATIRLPEGYRAAVITEAKRPLAEDADRRFQVAGGFKEFANWNWDKKPSKNDNIVKALDWIELSEAVANFLKNFRRSGAKFTQYIEQQNVLCKLSSTTPYILQGVYPWRLMNNNFKIP